jgi:hypothetical protein
MRIEFSISGRPPKKHGEKSMFSRSDEVEYVAKIREEALKARSKFGIDNCFSSWVRLELLVFARDVENIGDLDTFVSGVCDALQAADLKVLPHLHPIFERNKSIDPRIPILLEDDKKVVSIVAQKMQATKDYYTVIIESVDSK